MENTRLQQIVKNFLDDKLDAAGQREFYALLGDPRQREALAEIFMELTGQPDMGLSFDGSLLPLLEKATAVDVPRTTPVRRMRYWSWAAAAALLVIAAGVYRLTEQRAAQPAATVQRADKTAPGKQGAVLTLADGSTVMLDSMGNGVVASQGGTSVVLNEGQLAYDPGENGDAGNTFNTISTPRGRQFRIVLPDGTKVWLNAASSVRYPVAFTGNTREVSITGEAYFEVAADATKPFSVHFAEKGVVEVLGTAFNINAYTDEPSVKATLLRGSIRVNRQRVLQPGEQADINDNNDMTVNSDEDAENAIAWKNGLFVMSSTDLPALFRQISRWYDIEVIMKGQLPHRSFGGTIGRNVGLADIIEALNIYGVNCRLDNGQLIVQP
ncbi:FecR family protein [Chitinophaga sp. GCM10012297]|uniref:FecR domain-containing protein n=1 Tax=Chitinophaga chungangae TaxID=2821488 RepID=A0ABS3YG28_9BACT|nr:FecR family protein [Chitinophaga chungangae]MBO9153630.1 FecR domain-containing protein [Chitinophaga chungangae]